MAEQMSFGGPALVEYTMPGDELWRCSHFDRLAAEFPIAPTDLPLFHAAIAPLARQWLLVRRCFGLQPVLPPADYIPDDFRDWTVQELMAALNITRPQYQAELDVARGTWEAVRPKAQVVTPRDLKAEKEERAKAFTGNLTYGDTDILAKHGFDLKLKSTEEQWLAERVREFERLLTEKATKQLARNLLMSELQLRRLDDDLAGEGTMGTNWRENMKLRKDLQASYNDMLKMVNTLAPWASAITGKYAIVGVLSDMTRAIQEYKKGDTRLVDGFLTAMEIRVECRRSHQMPNPRYRAGLAVFVAAAKAGLWDPNWQSPFTEGELKKLDKAWAAAYVEASNEAGDHVPDLEKDGSEGEYDNLGPVVERESGAVAVNEGGQ